MDEQQYDALKLENQMCFPLYAASKELIRHYAPYLEKLDLTYTQYLALLVLWESGEITVKALGECLYLDSGTMTPVLKKLESKGLISRRRALNDERSVLVSLTEKGMKLRDEALSIPGQADSCVCLNADEKHILHCLLNKMLTSFREE